jgi:dTDP-glucose 4,6-dehydratase
LIIGGGGFQGSHLTEHWLEAGHEITVLNTPSEQTSRNIHGFEKDVQMVWGSITDREIVMKTVRGHDVVAHLAARVNVDESISVPSAVATVNVLGTANVLDAAVEHGARVIYASSCEVYGSAKPVPVTENSGLMPHSPYAASKAGADRLCFSYYKTFGLNVTVVRPCNIYGERQKEGRGGAVVAIFTRNALQGKPLTVFGSGRQTREYMHVSDVVAAYDLVLQRNDLAGETLNCGTGERIAIKDIAEFIGRRLGAQVQFGQDRPGEVDEFYLDSSKIRGYGFSPKVAFWEGLDRYLQWRVNQEKSLVPALVVAD